MVHGVKKRVKVTIVGYYNIDEANLVEHYEISLGPNQWEEAIAVDREQYGEIVLDVIADGLFDLDDPSVTLEYAA